MLAMLLILKTSQDLILIRQITQECVHTCTQNSSKSRDCTHNNNLLKVPYIKWKMKAVRAFCVFLKQWKYCLTYVFTHTHLLLSSSSSLILSLLSFWSPPLFLKLWTTLKLMAMFHSWICWEKNAILYNSFLFSGHACFNYFGSTYSLASWLWELPQQFRGEKPR